MSSSKPKFIPLTEPAVRELLFLAQEADKLQRIVGGFAGVQPKGDLPSLYRSVAKSAQMAVRNMRRLLGTLLNLQRFQHRFQCDPREVLDAVTPNLERLAGGEGGEAILQTWTRAIPLISEALKGLDLIEPVMVAEKAQQLAYTRQNVAVELRIITDFRPVFDDDAEKLVQAFISHQLVIDYFEGQNSRRIELALDAGDVAMLKAACERAQKKASCLKSSISGEEWQIYILNEPGDAVES